MRLDARAQPSQRSTTRSKAGDSPETVEGVLGEDQTAAFKVEASDGTCCARGCGHDVWQKHYSIVSDMRA
ncbi:MAG: hypothetical protein R2912_00555 [Eubacteriales bacterium]